MKINQIKKLIVENDFPFEELLQKPHKNLLMLVDFPSQIVIA